MLSVLVRVMELSGKQHLEEVWPNLEVFFHGGIAFTPYREQYKQIITKSDMHYMETYNASEGFFGIQDDPSDSSMSLMLDYGISTSSYLWTSLETTILTLFHCLV